MSVNMKKEIRAEIRQLRGVQRKISHDRDLAVKNAKRLISTGEAAILRAIRGAGRELERISERIAVLQGRLS
jgi:hypothetical protein